MRKFAFLAPSYFAKRCAASFATLGKYSFLSQLGLSEVNQGAYYDGKWQVTGSTSTLSSVNPTDGQVLATTKCATLKDYENAISAMKIAQREWATVPMPKRGDIVRQIGEALRSKKEALGNLISLEMGKIQSEGWGEVQ